MRQVAVIDYGMGNLDSVSRALEECGVRPVITSRREDIEAADALVLPGVGTFARGMENIRKQGLEDVLHEQARERQVPLLGLCLGMQLLASDGDESGQAAGLGLIDGQVRRLEPNGKAERIPHVGWNELDILRSSPLLAGIESGTDVYFVHSYHVVCNEPDDVIATTPYCSSFASVIGRGNVWGVQFHPEKSQKVGFRLLRNFLSL